MCLQKGDKMSDRIGIEIIITSEDERTIREYLNELWIKREWNSSKEDLNDRIRRVGDSYIVQFHETIDEDQVRIIHFYANILLERYCCKIQIITVNPKTKKAECFFSDGKKENLVHDEYWIIPIGTNNSSVFDYDFYTTPFISKISKQAAKVFSYKPELFEKWCGIHSSRLDSNDILFIGKSKLRKNFIDLDEYHKLLRCQDNNSGDGIHTANGKSMEEYNDNGILIHQKNSDEESWWDEKGQLIHTKTKYLETFYEYDDKGRLIREFYPEGYEIKYEYNRKGLLVEEKDSEGHRVINTYVNGVLTHKTCFNPKGQTVYSNTDDESESWYGYDDNGQVVYEVDPYFKDNFLDMDPDADSSVLGYKQRRYDSKGKVVFEYYSSCSYYSSYSDCCNFFFYDSKDRVIYTSCPNDDYWVHVYDDKDRLEYQMNDYRKTIRDYDGHHLDEKEQDFDPSSVCDRDGNLLYSYEKTKKEHKWFDDGNTYICRKLSEDELDYKYEWLEYDANNNLVRKIDFLIENKRGFYYYYNEYDSRNNLIHSISRFGDQEWCEYDENGSLIHRRDLLERFEI